MRFFLNFAVISRPKCKFELRNSVRCINTLQTYLCTGGPPCRPAFLSYGTLISAISIAGRSCLCIFDLCARKSRSVIRKRSRSTLIADENSFCLPVRNGGQVGFRVQHRAVNKISISHSEFQSGEGVSGLPRGGCEADHRAKPGKQFEGGIYDSRGSSLGEQRRYHWMDITQYAFTPRCRASHPDFLYCSVFGFASCGSSAFMTGMQGATPPPAG